MPRSTNGASCHVCGKNLRESAEEYATCSVCKTMFCKPCVTKDGKPLDPCPACGSSAADRPKRRK